MESTVTKKGQTNIPAAGLRAFSYRRFQRVRDGKYPSKSQRGPLSA
jgi:hypothetical protein